MSTIKAKHDGKWVKVPSYNVNKGVLDDATPDNKQYARKNGKWAEVNNGIEINENPNPPTDPDSEMWVDMRPIKQGVDVPEDAPKDDGIYARMNGGWRNVEESVRNSMSYEATSINKGYKVLKKDKSFKEQVIDTDTIYEIRYKFDLNGERITIPNRCILKYKGGSLINGTLVYQDTVIEGKDSLSNIDIEGRYTRAGMPKINQEDLTINNDVLELAPREPQKEFNPNTGSVETVSMGYVILRKDKSFAEQVTEPNTIYEIRYNFDLGGQTVNIPENCTLKFNGGSLSNGVLNGNNTEIEGSYNGILCNIKGTFNELNVRYFGIDNTGKKDCSKRLGELLQLCQVYDENIANSNSGIYFPKGLYLINQKITINEHLKMYGDGGNSKIIVDTNEEAFSGNPSSFCYDIYLNDLNFISKVKHKSILLKTTSRWVNRGEISNCQFNSFKEALNLKTSYWTRITNCYFFQCFVGIIFDILNSNSIMNCSFRSTEDTSLVILGGYGGMAIMGNDFSGGKYACIEINGDVQCISITGNYFEPFHNNFTNSRSIIIGGKRSKEGVYNILSRSFIAGNLGLRKLTNNPTQIIKVDKKGSIKKSILDADFETTENNITWGDNTYSFDSGQVKELGEKGNIFKGSGIFFLNKINNHIPLFQYNWEKYQCYDMTGFDIKNPTKATTVARPTSNLGLHTFFEDISKKTMDFWVYELSREKGEWVSVDTLKSIKEHTEITSIITKNLPIGSRYTIKDKGIITWNGSNFVDDNGFVAIIYDERKNAIIVPKNETFRRISYLVTLLPTNAQTGMPFYCTDKHSPESTINGIMIYWNKEQNKLVDALGREVTDDYPNNIV